MNEPGGTFAELGHCAYAQNGHGAHAHRRTPYCENWTAAPAPQAEGSSKVLNSTRPIQPIGAKIIDNPKFQRWTERGYARQQSDGLWLHYAAVCELLGELGAAPTETARPKLCGACQHSIDAHIYGTCHVPMCLCESGYIASAMTAEQSPTITGHQEYNVTDTQEGLSSEELAERFPKFFKPAEPESRETAGETTAEQFAVDICRELYDRFVMGGWQPEEGRGYVRDILEAHAKQRVEQAERRVKVLEQEIEQDGQMFADGKALILKLMAKVADLERERDEARDEAVHQNDLLKASESELREMREALPGVLHVLNSAPKQGWDKWRNAVDAIERLLARKAGSPD